MAKIDNLVYKKRNCFNCGCSHLFKDELKCSLNAKTNDGSDYKKVDEDSVKECWIE